MPITQTKKQSDIEKRLKLLRQQVYGRSEEKKLEVRGEKMDQEIDSGQSQITHQYRTSQATHPKSDSSATIHSDIVYLRHDLIKITSFAAIAFAVQIILYYLLTNNILKLPF